MDRKFIGRDSKDMLKTLDKKFIDNMQSLKINDSSEDEELQKEEKLKMLNRFNKIALTKKPSHLNNIRRELHAQWNRNRESIIQDLLANKPNEPVKKETTEQQRKPKNRDQRLADDKYSITIKWEFERPTQKHYQDLKQQMEDSGFTPSAVKYFFSDNYKKQSEIFDAFKQLCYQDPNGLILNLDLLFRYISLKLSETNPLMIYKSFDYLYAILDVLCNYKNYRLHNFEEDSILPFLVRKLGDPRYLVRKGARLILKQMIQIGDYIKLYDLLIKCLKEPKNNFIKLESLEEIGYLFDKFGLEKFDPESFREITKLILHPDLNIKNTALNVITLSFIKYGPKKIQDLIKYLDNNQLNLLEKHIEIFEQQSKIFPIKKSLFLIDSYTILEAIKSISGILRDDIKIQPKDQDFNDVEVLILDILDKNKDLSIVSLLDIKHSMKDQVKKKYILENIDQILMTCAVKLFGSVDEYLFSQDPNVPHLNELIRTLILVLNDVFESGMGKNTAVDSLKYLVYVIIKLTNDDNYDEDKNKNDLNNLLDLIFDRANQTTFLCCLIRLIKESFVRDYENKNKIGKSIISLVWKKLKFIEDECSKGLKISNMVDTLELLYEVHLFLEAVPVDTWDKTSNDLALRTINSVVYQIVINKKTAIFNDLEALNIPANAEIKDFVFSVLDWIEKK